jgi:hypothetical protein
LWEHGLQHCGACWPRRESVERWHAAAEEHGFAILALNWTEAAPTAASQEQLVANLPAIVGALPSEQSLTGDPLYLTSRGESTDMAWRAAYLDATLPVAATAFLGGAPEGDWENDADALASQATATPPLYYVMGRSDPDYAAASACFDAVVALGGGDARRKSVASPIAPSSTSRISGSG